jgi:hypothetical protein
VLYARTTTSPTTAATFGSTPNTFDATSAVPFRLMITSINEPKRPPRITTKTASRAPPNRSRTNSGIV